MDFYPNLCFKPLATVHNLSTESPLSHLELTTAGPILYMLPDPSGQHLTLEYLDDNIPAFYLVNLTTQEITKELSLGNDYQNVVLKSFSNEYVLTQRFSDQNNPNSVEIFSFRWGDPNPTFAQIDSQILDHGAGWIKTPHPHFQGKTVLMDVLTGEVLSQVNDKNKTTETRYPTAYSDQSSYFTWFEKLLNQQDLMPVKSCEFLKEQKKLIVSYYVIENKKVSNYLSIFDEQGQHLEKFLLADGLKGIGKDTFFVCNNQLIFVTGKSTLNVIHL
ncbi:hypothetical protein BGP76_18370 [Reichenbachiella sp. MSK19-1]|nr:hypothetical protein BGP76_18370 [Reichenbachiella sp. MSK19-1]